MGHGVIELVASTADPAFATDASGRIVAWNETAERRLGYGAGEVLGRRCHRILQGRDTFGNRYCGEHCPLREMALQGEAVGHFDALFRTATSGTVRTRVALIAVPDERSSAPCLIHVLLPADTGGPTGPAPTTRDGQLLERLTSREADVLGLLADGRGTAEIAERLFIARTTVRSHVQSILRKLGVHSRLEAVAKLRNAA